MQEALVNVIKCSKEVILVHAKKLSLRSYYGRLIFDGRPKLKSAKMEKLIPETTKLISETEKLISANTKNYFMSVFKLFCVIYCVNLQEKAEY